MTIADFETHILTLIDGMVETASDDELFAGGYLRGHITLAVAQAEAQGETDPQQLNSGVLSSLEQAIAAGELAPRDQVLVRSMWQTLFLQVSA